MPGKCDFAARDIQWSLTKFLMKRWHWSTESFCSLSLFLFYQNSTTCKKWEKNKKFDERSKYHYILFFFTYRSSKRSPIRFISNDWNKLFGISLKINPIFSAAFFHFSKIHGAWRKASAERRQLKIQLPPTLFRVILARTFIPLPRFVARFTVAFNFDAKVSLHLLCRCYLDISVSRFLDHSYVSQFRAAECWSFQTF